jgi:ABC-2 type transport system permease protein
MTTTTPAPADTAAGRRAELAPRAGWRAIARKELGDHVHSARFGILIGLVALAGLAAVHSASGTIRDAADAATQTPSVYLYLFTLSPDRVPAFHELVAIIGPLLGIAFGFDAINGERAQRTLPRLVAQPLHREEVINGKFVAGIAAIGVVLAALMTLVCAYGIFVLGVTPAAADLVRIATFYAVSVVYIGLWLALALLLSVATRRAATAALAGIAIWLVLTLFFGLIAGAIADAVHPVPADSPTTEEVLDNARFELNLRRLSPDQLYREATGVLLNPARQTTGIVVSDQSSQALPSTLSLGQSVLVAWWQLVILIATMLALFAGAYALFMRQEVRA